MVSWFAVFLIAYLWLAAGCALRMFLEAYDEELVAKFGPNRLTVYAFLLSWAVPALIIASFFPGDEK